VRLADVNLLLYAVDSMSPRHERARRWLDERLNGTEQVAFTWSTINGFLRLVTRRASASSPLDLVMAFDYVQAWLARPQVVVVDPTDRHLGLMRDLLEPLGTAGNLVTDAHLAALAIEHGAILESSDHDFGRFRGLRWLDPLSE
jgi:uncharacterized protein